MKTFIFLLICAIGGFYAYKHFTEQPPPPPPPKPAPRLAPPGVFFTKERFSEKTDFGVRALKAGVEVKLVSKDETTAVVADANNNQFKVPKEILTNDLDVRDAILKKIAEQAPKGSTSDPAAIQRGARIAELETEIGRQQLRIEELELTRSRTEEFLASQAGKGPSLVGDPNHGERNAREKINQLNEQIRISQRKIEDAQLEIKKVGFDEQPLPLKASRP